MGEFTRENIDGIKTRSHIMDQLEVEQEKICYTNILADITVLENAVAAIPTLPYNSIWVGKFTQTGTTPPTLTEVYTNMDFSKGGITTTYDSVGNYVLLNGGFNSATALYTGAYNSTNKLTAEYGAGYINIATMDNAGNKQNNLFTNQFITIYIY